MWNEAVLKRLRLMYMRMRLGINIHDSLLVWPDKDLIIVFGSSEDHGVSYALAKREGYLIYS